jgi:hypothetical protein
LLVVVLVEPLDTDLAEELADLEVQQIYQTQDHL